MCWKNLNINNKIDFYWFEGVLGVMGDGQMVWLGQSEVAGCTGFNGL